MHDLLSGIVRISHIAPCDVLEIFALFQLFDRFASLVLALPVLNGTAVLRMHRSGAFAEVRRTTALLLDPRGAIRVDFVAHTVGAAHGQVSV